MGVRIKRRAGNEEERVCFKCGAKLVNGLCPRLCGSRFFMVGDESGELPEGYPEDLESISGQADGKVVYGISVLAEGQKPDRVDFGVPEFQVHQEGPIVQERRIGTDAEPVRLPYSIRILQQEQTRMTPPDGNCYAACLATILGVPLDEVPTVDGIDDWLGEYNKWLKQYALALVISPLPQYDHSQVNEVFTEEAFKKWKDSDKESEEPIDIAEKVTLQVRSPRRSVYCGSQYQNAPFGSGEGPYRANQSGIIVPTLRSFYRDEEAGEGWKEVRAFYMPGLTILGAVSGTNSEFLHAVVCYDGRIVFDPSPGRKDGVGAWVDVSLFVSLNPGDVFRQKRAIQYVERVAKASLNASNLRSLERGAESRRAKERLAGNPETGLLRNSYPKFYGELARVPFDSELAKELDKLKRRGPKIE